MSTATVTPATIRAWALKKGLDVGERGRISSEIRDAYNKAHRVK